ncbi:caspase family protein [Streptomyces sp. NPDC012888]|uniref:caspase family protein n=1 Tax=Streptomyces sp. NPDC012888 TaxID=3364855 RepID=UPI0036948B36
MGTGDGTGTVYALLVGVNEYGGSAYGRLRGCVNDVRLAREVLQERTAGRIDVLELLDREAGVTAVASAVRTHLGQAGPRDTALLWFSGHGTEYAAVTAAELAAEPTGRCQALVCADGPLPDKTLGALLDGVAAGGAHVVAVLDCCFSAGATREEGARARVAPWAAHWPAPVVSRDPAGPAPRARHVLLAASRIDRPAFERPVNGPEGRAVVRGVFSHSLATAVRAAPPRATARELLAGAQAEVRRRLLDGQHPVLWPAEAGGLADRPLLGGPARTPDAYLLREGPDGWEVDCGRVHGLTGEAGTEFTVAGAEPTGAAAGAGAWTVPGARAGADAGAVPGAGDGPRVVRAVAVRADRTLVEPVGWAPERGSVRPVVLSALALPPAAVLVDAPPERAEAAALLAAGLTSPLLRVLPEDPAGADPAALRFRVSLRGRVAHVLRPDGSPYVEPLEMSGPADVPLVAACLAHLTHWHRIRDLSSGLSPLGGHVRLEIRPWADREGPPLVPDGRGEIGLEYADGEPPWVSVRLRNTGHRPLWCVLVDLDDQFGAGTSLFPGQYVGAGLSAQVWEGDPVRMALPESRPARPGAVVRDWLTLIVAEAELNTVPFHLDSWDPAQAGAGTRRAPSGDLLRLESPRGGTAAGSRDLLRAGPGTAGQWAAASLALRTVVPGRSGAVGRPAPGRARTANGRTVS